ncbi:carbon-nitrogen hydrolase [Marinagarivorans cellulosilyticus]|uniref:N-carbamoylputrescine amidase n=1 Tax=Marinagarivorans cellulosilyticus TaxID=2721545 RepID=A0AAN1WK01_9GAMM|nr:carbon-nitrogen hydrolase [Marinagarivorans cellulosilyticus]BCD98992.1 N-carbamoylputrescine amidase [Marinagarivorans cellulosilyticus]
MASSGVIKAAVLQLSVASDNKAENFEVCARHVRGAAADGCKLVVLQELHATRYFCQQEDVECFDLAEPLDGETYSAYEALAAELDVVMVISQFERRAAGLYHNTAQVIDGKLGRAGIFRKMHIPDDPGFYEKFYFTPGDADAEFDGFKPVQTQIGKLGVLVCWDQWYPEAARLMALAGADMLIYPTAIGWDPADDAAEKARQQDAWVTIQRAHAVANGLPTLVANRTGFEADPAGPSGIQFWGTSFVAGPQGELLVKAPVEEQGFYSAEIDMQRSEAVRRIWPYFRDRRVDAYSGLVKRWRENSL